MGKLPFEKTRKIITRYEEETSASYGCLPHKRPIKQFLDLGIVNMDKPPGPTSTQVSDWVKTILKAGAAGHTGTLDPNVSGCLPIALDNATKITSALLPAGKEYMVLMHLHEKVAEKDLKKVLKEFTGKIYQRPPTKSAVRKDLRIRTIYYTEILEIKEKDVLFRCGCQGGTYIRRLVHDIGVVLGCGAHMQQLRRTRAGPFTEETVVTLQKLADAYYYLKEKKDETLIRAVVQPFESAMAHLPRVFVSDSCVDALCHGSQLALPGIAKMDSGISANELVGVYTLKGEGVLLAKALLTSEEMKKKKKGLAVKTERVLMKTGVYPKNERK
jgi:H/ACA ribonucleoprotein complex subunit 4|tara:strand:- start:1003 stop:1989 length:987 start_codon:yes stop_codon:yes gene_type:complete